MFERYRALVWILPLILLQIGNSKKIFSYFSLGEIEREKCVFLTRFTPTSGTGNFELHLQSWAPPTKKVLMSRLLILNWEGFEMFRTLDRPSEAAITSLDHIADCHISPLAVSLDRNITTKTATHFGRPDVDGEYYFYVCSHDDVDSNRSKSDESKAYDDDMMTVRYHLSVTGADGSEIDAVDAKLMWLMVPLMVAYTTALYYCISKVVGYYNRNKHVSYPLIIVMVAVACSWFSTGLKLVEFLIEYQTGHRFTYFEVFYDIGQILVDFLISILIVVVLRFWLANPDSKRMGQINRSLIALLYCARYGWMLSLIYSSRSDIQRYRIGSYTGTVDLLLWLLHSLYIVYLISELVRHRRKTNIASKLWAVVSVVSFSYVFVRPFIVRFLDHFHAELSIYTLIHMFDLVTSLFLMITLTDREQVFSVTSLDLTNIGETTELQIGRDN